MMEEYGIIALKGIVLAVMSAGLVSLIIPIIPGLTIIWVAALVYGLITGFTWINGLLFLFITLLMIFGNIVDNLMMGGSAKHSGASWLAIGVALLAGIVGSIYFPPLGGLLAALLGIFIVELIRLKDIKHAWKSLRSMATGCGWAVLIRIGIGLIMIFWWSIWAFIIPLIENNVIV